MNKTRYRNRTKSQPPQVTPFTTAARCQCLALKSPRTIPGITDEDMVYHDTTKNLDAYNELGIAEKFPIPAKEELIAFLHDTIESYDGTKQAAWEIHCAAHLIKMLNVGGAK